MKKDFTDIINESESERLGKLYPVILEKYKLEYPTFYLAEKEFLQRLLGAKILRISHIGSTAVTDLISKPTIDILLEVHENTDLTEEISYLTQNGYIVNRPPNDIIMFIKGYGINGFDEQCFHIHIRNLADHNEFYFRDYLIAHHETAKEYGELKKSLQQKYKHDRDAYTFAKSEFIVWKTPG